MKNVLQFTEEEIELMSKEAEAEKDVMDDGDDNEQPQDNEQ